MEEEVVVGIGVEQRVQGGGGVECCLSCRLKSSVCTNINLIHLLLSIGCQEKQPLIVRSEQLKDDRDLKMVSTRLDAWH